VKTTAEWVEKLKGEGLEIDFQNTVLGFTRNGAYFWESDRIELTYDADLNMLFHELSHWTGHKDRLNRDLWWAPFNQSSVKEELIAWESTQTLGVKLGFKLNEECLTLFTKWTDNYLNEYPKEEALAASSYLIHRFGL